MQRNALKYLTLGLIAALPAGLRAQSPAAGQAPAAGQVPAGGQAPGQGVPPGQFGQLQRLPPPRSLTPADARMIKAQPALKDVFKGAFMVGAAVNPSQTSGRDELADAIVQRHFNTITPENELKFQRIHPQPGKYDFRLADQFVEYGRKHHMFMIGHTLVWHSQTPRWVFQDSAGKPVSRDTLLARMKDHIYTVVGRYRGKVKGWDVVNEALNEDGTLRDSPWRRIIGDDFIAKAFQFAHEADPKAELYYNDYGLERPSKRDGMVALVKKLQAEGIPITAVGTQEHDQMDVPTIAEMDSLFEAIASLGVKAAVTELDVAVVPRRNFTADVSARQRNEPFVDVYAAGLPDSVAQAHAQRYADIFAVFLRHKDILDRVTFWGVTDRDSWLNGFPSRRTEYPLLFDRQGRPKPAFQKVVNAAINVAATP